MPVSYSIVNLFSYEARNTDQNTQLIMICGLPSSGKTTRAKQIQKFFEDRIAAAKAEESPDKDTQRIARCKVHYFSDETLGLDREMYRGMSSICVRLVAEDTLRWDEMG